MKHTALITGGNRGIGYEVARQLGAQGNRIILGVRDIKSGNRAAGELRSAGIDARAVLVDVASSASVRACAAELDAQNEHIDILINNAAIIRGGGKKRETPSTIMATSEEEWREILDINVLGTVWMCQAFIPGMVARGYGRVVNVSSSCGSFARGLSCDESPYAVSKAAVNAITLKLAEEVKGNIKINAVDPGWVRTRMGGEHAPRSIEEGADTIVWAATLPAAAPTGAFFRDRSPLGW